MGDKEAARVFRRGGDMREGYRGKWVRQLSAMLQGREFGLSLVGSGEPTKTS